MTSNVQGTTAGTALDLVAADDDELPVSLQFLSQQDVDSDTIKKDPYHPDRMGITQQEYERALAVKEAIRSTPELDLPSDFMCLQLAIVATAMGESLEDSLERCRGLQAFAEEYSPTQSYAEGCRMLEALVGFWPRQFLAFHYSPPDGAYVFCWDMGQFEPAVIKTQRQHRQMVLGRYYCHLLFHRDVQSCRSGFITLIECQNLTLRREAIKMDQEFFGGFLQYYPFLAQARQFHTGVFTNTVWSILKRFLPTKVKDNFQVGLKWDGHLGECLLTPTVQEANQRMLSAMKLALKRRLNMEQSFRLGDYRHAHEQATRNN